MRLRTPDGGTFGEKVSMLLDLVFGDEDQQALIEMRLRQPTAEMDPGEATEAQGRVRNLARSRVEALVAAAIGDLDRWQRTLHAIANQIEDLDVRARAKVVDTTEVEP